jgi:hypothetical protein
MCPELWYTVSALARSPMDRARQFNIRYRYAATSCFPVIVGFSRFSYTGFFSSAQWLSSVLLSAVRCVVSLLCQCATKVNSVMGLWVCRA